MLFNIKLRQVNIFLVVFLFLLLSPLSQINISQAQTDYPRLANYFLKWTIDDSEAQELAKWDLLILDMEVQENSRTQLEAIRTYNPNIQILAYITSQEIIDYPNNPYQFNAPMRQKLYYSIDDGWWLRNGQNEKISFWSGTYMLNLSDGAGTNSNGERWNDFLPRFVDQEILSTGLWDGVFYDNLWGDVGWVNGDNIDIDNNGNIKSYSYINNRWAEGTKKMAASSRQLNSDKLIIGNGKIFWGFQEYLNGMMLEDFPSSWENGGTWAGSLESYLSLADYNREPQISLVHIYSTDPNDLQRMRFGLTSTLMDNGYFSFDYSQARHEHLWRYDEYETTLGQPQKKAYNLLSNNSYPTSGLWRRDFDSAIALVNSTNKQQSYVFNKEEFEKLQGTQDTSVNDGTIVNWVRLEPEDGVILFKRQTEITDQVFDNGVFVRVFDDQGEQPRNGFFAYLDSFPGQSQVLITDLDNDQEKEILVNYQGTITIYKDGRESLVFQPYQSQFSGAISIAVSDLNGDGTKEIITGAGPGGGPHVRVFSKDGQPLIGGFFAYDKDFRGGVNVVVLDLNNDGTKEIITGAGPGGGPHVRVFSKDGQPLIGGFFAYDREFTGGVNLAVGDVNNDGQGEIVTGAGRGGSPRVKIYTKDGEIINQFLAYDSDFLEGIKVMVADVNNDNNQEILAGTLNF